MTLGCRELSTIKIITSDQDGRANDDLSALGLPFTLAGSEGRTQGHAMMPGATFFQDAAAGTVDLDVAIIGAGISGINVAYRLQEKAPTVSYKVFERRADLGGTWSFLKFPGIRSDSDLWTFGFPWRAWQSESPIATADKILAYLKESASWAGIDKHIEFNTDVAGVDWSSAEQAWTLKLVQEGGAEKAVKARFLIFASGYWDYKEPFQTVIPGIERFKGQVVHPQFWPENLDYANKHVVVVGSGATAVTMIPTLAKTVASVTMLQRSPSFIGVIPTKDLTATFLRAILPATWAHSVLRWKYILVTMLLYQVMTVFPRFGRWLLLLEAKEHLPKGYPIKPHLDPVYNPWQQRLCLCPDGDFFEALSGTKAKIVTGTIDTVTEYRILLKSHGEEKTALNADIIVTATGLKMLAGGGAKLTIDGVAVDFGTRYMWKGSMLEGVPNMAYVIGYSNASWTLGSDATSLLVARLLKHMKAKGLTSVTPTVGSLVLKEKPLLTLTSTYFVKARKSVPKAGDQYPWLPRSSYISDLWEAKYERLMAGLEGTSAEDKKKV